MGKRLKRRGVVEIRLYFPDTLTRETKQNGTMSVTNAYGSTYTAEELCSGNMQIKGAGNSTWNNPQKPFNLTTCDADFKKKVAPFLGMPPGSGWRFLADFFDASKLRNILAMDIADDVETEWASDMVKAEVWINDVYQGLYTVCEKVERATNKVNINKDTDFLVEKQAQSQIPATEGSFQDGVIGFWHSFKEPDVLPTDAEKIATAKARMDAYYNAILSGDYKDAVDVPSHQRMGLVQDLTKSLDAFNNSLYHEIKAGEQKIKLQPAWDFDVSLAIEAFPAWDTGLNVDYTNPNDTFLNAKSPVFAKLMQDADFREGLGEIFKDALPRLHQTLVDLEDFVEALEATGAPARNAALWGGESYTVHTQRIIAFYRQRLYWQTRKLYDVVPPKPVLAGAVPV